MTEAALPVLLEVCVDSVESALSISAIRGGADRLELCANLAHGGGTTPSLGLLTAVQNTIRDASVMVMVRPRTGDFVYSEEEISVMLGDIHVFKKCGVRGIVTGALTTDGRVDVECMKRLIDAALPLEVCFHRAFDMTRNLEEAINDIAGMGGIARILTSGQGLTAPDSLDALKKLFQIRRDLVENDPWGLSILPGSGINGQNATQLLESLVPLGLKEIHLSGGMWVESAVSFRREGMRMGVGQNEWSLWRTQEDKVREVRYALDSHSQEHANLYPLAPVVFESPSVPEGTESG